MADEHPLRPRPHADTHFCEWDAPGKYTVPALCGAYIRRRDHVNDPTCAICRVALAAREAEERGIA
jgi:hypothetical protein